MKYSARISIMLAVVLIAIVGVFFVQPIPQDPAYHLFADLRSCLGIPNFGNVASNIAFTVVGIVGLWLLVHPNSKKIFDTTFDKAPYAIFFFGVALIGVGSAYYHWQPNNETLFWDRLPMTIAFMAFMVGVITDRVHREAGLKILLPILLALGVASLLYWVWTENAGKGDLRFYGLVQFLPMVLIPIICWLFPKARYTQGKYLVWIIVWYGIAKVFEYFDAQVYDVLGMLVSGHTIKHLAAAVATAFVIPMVMPKTKPL